MTDSPNEQMRQKHNELILKMAGYFHNEMLIDKFKQMFRDDIEPNDLDSAKTVMAIVNLLEQDRKISIGNYTFLKDKIAILNRAFVEDHINRVEKEIESIRANILATSTPGQGDPKDNPMDNRYPIKKGQKGLALIFNMTKDRPGYQHDKSNLLKLFEKTLGFEVKYKEDRSKTQILEHVDEAKSLLTENDGNTFYCFVCVVMSHGDVNGIQTNDKKMIKIGDITKLFDSINLEKCAGMPKIFIVQTCRGDKIQEVAPKNKDNVFYEDDTTVPRDADILIAYATKEDYAAVRDPEKGSWFIYTLVEVLIDNYKKGHLEEMLVTVRRNVARLRCDCEEKGQKITLSQIPCSLTTLTKLFYLTATN